MRHRGAANLTPPGVGNAGAGSPRPGPANLEWRLLRMDPVLGTSYREVARLRDDMALSAETTLLGLARWLHRRTAAV